MSPHLSQGHKSPKAKQAKVCIRRKGLEGVGQGKCLSEYPMVLISAAFAIEFPTMLSEEETPWTELCN